LFTLKPHSGVPIYRQLLEQIRRMVASGQLEPGTELPSIRELALRHTINPMTVSKVYTLLEAEGVLERHRGKPMTVAAQRKAKEPLAARTKQLDPQLDALVLAARQLEVGMNEVVEALKAKWEMIDDRATRSRMRAKQVL
jgi:GntR family transcriptional regulator